MLANNEPESDPRMDSEMDAESETHRPRKEHLYEQIMKQLEFYLGDANLSKDRYLSKTIRETPEIPVDLFLSFNKIRSITGDVKDLVTAIRKSSLLALTEDEAKVFRKTQIQKRDNLDECTIYVENIPSDAHHEWLQSIFSIYGNVLYVSIPKFKNKSNKGFAFIEFDSPKCVAKALEAFGAAGCRLPANMPCDQLLSIRTFEDDGGKALYNPRKKMQDLTLPLTPYLPAMSDETPTVTDEKPTGTLGKRKRGISEEDNASKRTREEGGTVECAAVTDEKPTAAVTVEKPTAAVTDENPVATLGKRKRNTSEEDNASKRTREEVGMAVADIANTEGGNVIVNAEMLDADDEEINSDCDDEEKRNQFKLHNNKEAKNKHYLEVASLGLQILPKQEWKRLRNLYLNSQRQKLAQLKHKAQEALAQAAAQEETAETTDKVNPPTYEMVQGVVLKILPEKKIEDITRFKTEVRGMTGVVYVDIIPDRDEVYVRCASSETASALLAAKPWPNTSLLQGDEEQWYWQKIIEDRSTKFQTKKKIRGRGKMKVPVVEEENKISGIQQGPKNTIATKCTHIRFTDDDEDKETSNTTSAVDEAAKHSLDSPTQKSSQPVTVSNTEAN